MSRSTIIVLGMHRSGTSALTRVLNLGGAELPEDLTEAIPGNNEKGFFESRELLLINIRLLQALGTEWWSASPLDPKRFRSRSLDENRRQIRRYLAAQLNGRDILLLKDPRMCRLFPLWKSEIRKAKSDLGVVLALRDPRAVASSLNERDGIPLEHGYLLWLRHMLEAERSSRGTARLIVCYESLLADWKPVVATIAEKMKRVWRPDWSDSAAEVSGFLENRLNHFDGSVEGFSGATLVAEAYSAFMASARGTMDEGEFRNKLDGIVDKLTEVDQLVGQSLDYTIQQYVQQKLENSRQQATSELLETLSQEFSARVEKLDESSKARADLERRVEGLQSDLKRMREYAEGLQAHRDKLADQLKEVNGALADRRQQQEELTTLKKYAEGLREDRDRIRDVLSDVRQSLQVHQQHFSKVEQERDSALRSLENARHQRNERETELRQLQGEHESVARALANARQQRDEKDSALRQLQGEHTSISKALEQARSQRNEKEGALRQLQAEHESTGRALENARRQRNENEASLTTAQGELKSALSRLEENELERQYLGNSLSHSKRELSVSRRRVDSLRRSSQEKLKQQNNLAEQTLRDEMMKRLPQTGGTFNIWRHEAVEIERDPQSQVAVAGVEAGSADRWMETSPAAKFRLARQILSRRLFDPGYYRGGSGGRPLIKAIHYLSGGWREHEPHPLFDSQFYCQQAFGVAPEKVDGCPLVHYLLIGSREGLSPHPLFDPAYYRSQLPAAMADSVEPLSHYLSSGHCHLVDPHWAFSVHWYLSQNEDVRVAGAEPLSHYLAHGESEGRSPHPFVSLDYYAEQVGSVDAPLVDFVLNGVRNNQSSHPLIDVDHLVARNGPQSNWFRYLMEGTGDIRPNHLFSYAQYQQLNPDVSYHPLVHYLEFGWRERRPTHVLFDARFYAEAAAIPADTDPLVHYFRTPPTERISAHPMFDESFYRDRHADLKGTRHGLFDHYVRYGGNEGRRPGPGFDPGHYLAQVDPPDGWNPLEHFLLVGRRLGLEPRLDDRGAAVADWTYCRGDVDPEPGRPGVLLVAHVASSNLFGSERSFLDMVEGMRATDLVDVIVCLPQNEPEYVARILPFVTGVYIRPYPWWGIHQEIDRGTVEAFVRLIAAEPSIRAVHVNTMMPREPLLAARTAGVPGIVHVREIIDKDEHLRERIGLGWQEIVSRQHDLADFFVCNSEATQRLYPDHSFVVPNTIDVLDFEKAVAAKSPAREGGCFSVGMISSNLEKKGIADLVELARSMADDSRFKFLLIGPETPDLLEIVTGAPANVVCTGYVEDPAEAIARLDVVVNFSHFAESFGRTILEAMAASKPVIVYDYGALPYLVEDGESGYIVPYRSALDAKPLLEKFASDESLRVRLGRRGRQIALEKFDVRIYVERLADAYQLILNDDTSHGSRPQRPSALSNHEISAKEVLPAKFDRTETDRPIRIAYFQWHFPVPSETFVLNELRDLVAQGHDVHVYCRQSPYRDFTPDFDIGWTRVDTPEELASALTQTGRNIVHSHFTYPTVTDMVWPACQLSGSQFTFCAHAQDIFRYDNDAKNRIGEVVSAPECVTVFVPGRFHFDYLVERGVPADKIVINPQGIDTTLYPEVEFQHVGRSGRRLCAVHRFTQKKGIESVIRAAARVAELGIEIDLYGYGDDVTDYRDLIDKVGAENLHIHEGVISREQMIDVFAKSDLFLAPSVRADDGDMDGIPTVVMEAMMCGLPVLTTNVSSLAELVMDGHTGVVCEPGDPASLAAAIERFYAMSDVDVERMIEAAALHVRDRFDVQRLLRMSKRVWQQTRLDIVLVTWNNLPELQEVVSRIYRFTHFPFHLIICDNDSDQDVKDFLGSLYEEHDNLTLIHKGKNSMVGPGTNTAISRGDGEFVVYICGREGFISQPFWDSAVVNYMTENPSVGLAGTLCYSPSYLFGRDYPKGVAEWENFRNQSFAVNNPDRMFSHVQGGFFAMRRSMLDEIGGFSDTVPHNYTDVEFSYYVESCGWELGEIPHVLALFNKTRPDIVSRLDESVFATHPPTLDQVKWLDSIAVSRGGACNVCGYLGESKFDTCDACGSVSMDRSLYRVLAESVLTYRRLPALAIGLGEPLKQFWTRSFQGGYLSGPDSLELLAEQGRFDHADGRLRLIVIRGIDAMDVDERSQLLSESRRLLNPGEGELWLQPRYQVAGGESRLLQFSEIIDQVDRSGFRVVEGVRYSSAVIDFDAHVILKCI